MIKKYLEFINEASDEALKQHKIEKAFVSKMKEKCKKLLNSEEDEYDPEHPVNDKMVALIYSVYDRQYMKKANSEGLTDKDYDNALETISKKLDDYKVSKTGAKKIDNFKIKMEKEKTGEIKKGKKNEEEED